MMSYVTKNYDRRKEIEIDETVTMLTGQITAILMEKPLIHVTDYQHTKYIWKHLQVLVNLYKHSPHVHLSMDEVYDQLDSI